jgi:uncharacterized protein YndB with AHSA1/START domain
MTGRSVEHAKLTIEREYNASPTQVFAAWANEQAKKRWFADGQDWETLDYGLDFRVGGREHARSRYKGGPVSGNETVYLDIVPERRIIFVYTMRIDGTPISASLGTVELLPSGAGTKLIYTEQGAHLDGLDKPDMRRTGWAGLLDQLGAELAR